MSVINTLLTDFIGSPVLFSVFVIMIFIVMSLFIRSGKYVIESIALLAVYFMMESGFIAPWVLFVVIVIIGIDIGKLIITTFIS
jgi:hypothetical protein